MIDLHLVSWNRPKMTELVIRAIHRNTKRDNFRLVVLDNGSDEETQAMIQRLADHSLIDELFQFDTNIGLEAARQVLLEQATRDKYFVCIDNDCLPPPQKEGQDWLERMVGLMEKYEGYGAISQRTQVMIGTGNIFEEADNNGDELVDFPHPGGSFRIMPSNVVKDLGGWDRRDPGRGSEERYIGSKLHEAGFKTAFATDIRCLHLFGTRGEDGTDRWGYDKDMKPEDTGHSDIWHPILGSGDDKEEVSLYVGEELADAYCNSPA